MQEMVRKSAKKIKYIINIKSSSQSVSDVVGRCGLGRVISHIKSFGIHLIPHYQNCYLKAFKTKRFKYIRGNSEQLLSQQLYNLFLSAGAAGLGDPSQPLSWAKALQDGMMAIMK